MATEIKVPTLGESVSEATIGKWFKKPGDAVAVDEAVLGIRCEIRDQQILHRGVDSFELGLSAADRVVVELEHDDDGTVVLGRDEGRRRERGSDGEQPGGT